MMTLNSPMDKPKVPYLPITVDWNLISPTYFNMIFQILSPHFNFRSITSAFLLITSLCLIVPNLFQQPMSYQHFLGVTKLPYVYLQPALIRRNPLYLYQCFTSIFFHAHYKHFAGSMMVVFLKMAPLEYIWWPSPLLALLGGFITNCYFVVLSNYQFMGFTGVVASSIGMYAGFLILNWPYLIENYSYMIKPWLFGWLFVLIFFILSLSSWKFFIFHMISVVLGVYMGIAFTPMYHKTVRERWLAIGFRLFALAIIVIPLVLIVHKV